MRTLFDPPSAASADLPIAPLEPAIRPDGQRACAVCGEPAPFGFGVSLRHDRPGRWSCLEHRSAVEAMREPRP